MTTEMMLQPTERMWEVQRLVVAEGRSTHTVAEMLGMGQRAVCETIEQCLSWLAETLPAQNARIPKEVRLAMAEQIAVTRLDHLHTEAMRAWRASQGDTYQQQHRRSGTSSTVETTTVRREQGNIRYLAAAMQIAIKMAKLPFAIMPLASMKHSPDFEYPPVGDCSAAVAEQEALETASPQVDEASPVEEMTCETSCEQAAAEVEPQLSVFAPAQPDLSTVLTRAAAEQAFGPPRNRHERRARQKMLDRQLRKAK